MVQPDHAALGVLAQGVALRPVSQALGIPGSTAFRCLRPLGHAGGGSRAATPGSRGCARCSGPLLADPRRPFGGPVNLAVGGDRGRVCREVIDWLAGQCTTARSGDAPLPHATEPGKEILADVAQHVARGCDPARGAGPGRSRNRRNP